ncbi:MAG: Spy/CpxP family protein refolding chaperone [Desulfobaccales bacterium]
MKRLMLTKGLPVMLMLVLVLGLSTAAWARPFGCGPGGMNITPEQAGQLFDLKQQFMNDTASIRKAMWMKRAEMAALWKAETPDQAKITAKQKEMNALREQLQEKMVAFRIQARKIAPMGPGKGMGKGMSMGPGMGMGMQMGMAMACDGPGMGMMDQ